MIRNDDMKAGRFLRWQDARRRLALFQSHLDRGGTVFVSTHTRHTKFTAKHRDCVRATRNGLQMASGRRWVSIDYCRITHV